MFYDILHFTDHIFPEIFERGVIDRAFRSKAGGFHRFSGAHPVKLDPYVFPWESAIGDVGRDLLGEDHESLSASDLVFVILPFKIRRHEPPCAGQDIVEQVVAPCGRTERIGGIALFSSELVHTQIDEIFVWEYGKNMLTHSRLLFTILKSIKTL